MSSFVDQGGENEWKIQNCKLDVDEGILFSKEQKMQKGRRTNAVLLKQFIFLKILKYFENELAYEAYKEEWRCLDNLFSFQKCLDS